MSVARGSVVLVDLNPTHGHEQSGMRPCVVVSDPALLSALRFPMVAVVPLTTTRGLSPFYPVVSSGGLRTASAALVDQVRALDARRVTRVYGTLGPAELASVDGALRRFLRMQ